MADRFNIASFWEMARDTLNALDTLWGSLMHFRNIQPSQWYEPGTPPFARRGRRPKPPDFEDQFRKAGNALRNAGENLVALLAEDRFLEPKANVWPPSAPQEFVGKFAHALLSVPKRYFDTAAWDIERLPDERLVDLVKDSEKKSLFTATCAVRGIVIEIEKQPDLAERAYQQARCELRPTTGDLIERLHAGPDDVRLSPEEYAYLKAFLSQPGNRICLSALAKREPDRHAKLRLILNFNRNLQAISVPPTAKADVAEINGTRKRWVWDLYPLVKDSWGAWELEDEHRPDHRVYIRRRKGNGYLEPPASNDLIFRLMERGDKPDDYAVREGYAPTTDDVAMLQRLYPSADPYRPAWYNIKADLVAAGEDADRLDKSEAPVLLALLRKAQGSAVAEMHNGAKDSADSIPQAAKPEQSEGEISTSMRLAIECAVECAERAKGILGMVNFFEPHTTTEVQAAARLKDIENNVALLNSKTSELFLLLANTSTVEQFRQSRYELRHESPPWLQGQRSAHEAVVTLAGTIAATAHNAMLAKGSAIDRWRIVVSKIRQAPSASGILTVLDNEYRRAVERISKTNITPIPEGLSSEIEAKNTDQLPSVAETEHLEGNDGKNQGGKAGKRGRPKDTDPKEDKRVYEAWITGQYAKYEDLGRELKQTKLYVKRAIDRHKKRLRDAADSPE